MCVCVCVCVCVCGGVNFTSPVSFPLIIQNGKSCNLGILQHLVTFCRDISAKFGISNLLQSPDIWKNSDEGISDFRISGQSLIKVNCHNSRTSNDIEMKLGPLTKLDKRNKTTSKKLTMTSCR